jgi:hypothetical protein
MKSTRRSDRRQHSFEPPTPRSRPDDGNAFVPDNLGTLEPLPAPDAEAFAQEFVTSATTAESVFEDAEDEVVDDETGGPFLVLEDDASLPPEPILEEPRAERAGEEEEEEGGGDVQDRTAEKEAALRAARWASRKG